MKLYRITTKNNSELLINADKVDVLNSGQIVLYKKNEVISIFSKDTDIVCAEDDKANFKHMFKDKVKNLRRDVHLIDDKFGTDVFLKINTPQDAYEKLRKITTLVNKTIDALENFNI